jgi:hypothetical protein
VADVADGAVLTIMAAAFSGFAFLVQDEQFAEDRLARGGRPNAP